MLNFEQKELIDAEILKYAYDIVLFTTFFPFSFIEALNLVQTLTVHVYNNA